METRVITMPEFKEVLRTQRRGSNINLLLDAEEGQHFMLEYGESERRRTRNRAKNLQCARSRRLFQAKIVVRGSVLLVGPGEYTYKPRSLRLSLQILPNGVLNA